MFGTTMINCTHEPKEKNVTRRGRGGGITLNFQSKNQRDQSTEPTAKKNKLQMWSEILD